MVGYLGHVAVALLFALPAWFLWNGRVSLAFVGFAVSTSVLPDVDTQTEVVAHHGITHTIVFVTVVAFAGGALVAATAAPLLRQWWWETEDQSVSEEERYVFVIGGLLLGGLSHLVADMLSHPDGVPPVEPFWPFFSKPFEVDLVYYADPKWNSGLLLAAVSLHLLMMYADVGPTRYATATADNVE